MPLKPTMVFVHADKPKQVASFHQNSLLRLEIGAEAEVIFPAIPGRVFKGKVLAVLPVIDKGLIQASGTLGALSEGPSGRSPTIIQLH
jgi:multidrug resistance efflux pump